VIRRHAVFLDGGAALCKATKHAIFLEQQRGEPMSGFDKREDDFEKKFAHDEELRFRAYARRNKMVGLWAAGKLGLTGAAADSYAAELVAASVARTGNEDLLNRLRKDFDEKGVAQSDHQIQRTMEEMLARAVAEIQAGR
jgi:hypothetical protein